MGKKTLCAFLTYIIFSTCSLAWENWFEQSPQCSTLCSPPSSFVLLAAPSSLSLCSCFPPASSLFQFLILSHYKLEGRDCFFFIFLASRVSVLCCKKPSHCKDIQLNYSFFKPSSSTSIPYYFFTLAYIVFCFPKCVILVYNM